MKNKLMTLVFLVSILAISALALASTAPRSVFAGGDQVHGEKSTGPSLQLGETPFGKN